MTKKQDIVPVTLRDENKNQQRMTNRQPQKLVARLKCTESEMFIYEGIHDSTLKILLSELYINEVN